MSLRIPTTLIVLALAAPLQPLLAQNAPKAKLKADAAKPGRARPKTTSSVVLESSGDAAKKSEAELIKVIQGVETLLKVERNEAKRDTLLMSESGAALALSRSYRLKADSDAKSKANERRYSQLALRNSDAVIKSKSASAMTKARAHYYAGLALTNLNDANGAQKRFIESLNLYPQADYAPAMSLMIAETSFDQEKYKDAIAQYRILFSRLTDGQKAIAVYKTGWSYINLQSFELAEKSFLLLAGKKWAGGFAEDSIKDLAYVMTQHRNETNVIEFAARHFGGNAALKAEVLTAVYKTFQAQSRTNKMPVLYSELMRTETDPAKRLLLVISNMRAQRRDYASMETFREFQDLRGRIRDGKIAPDSPIFAKIITELEPEIQSLIKSFGETFSGKTKTPEPIEKGDMGRFLQELLEFHLAYFPKSNDRATSYGLVLTVCEELKDTQCTYRVSKQVLAEEPLAALHRRARLVLLASLETLSSQSKDRKFRDEFIQRLTAFYNDMPKDQQWLPLTKRLTALMNEDKNFVASIPILQRLNDVEKTSEARYRLLWALFETERYDEVVGSVEPLSNDKFGQDSKSLIREAHLRLAAQKGKTDDFSAYETHVKGYLATSPDQQKADVVYRDYLTRLLERKQFDRVHAAVQQLTPAKRLAPEYKSVTQRLVDAHIKAGRFNLVTETIGTEIPKEAAKDFDMDWFQSSLASGRELKPADFARIGASEPSVRTYVLGVLTLTQPLIAIDYFRQAKTLSATELKLFLLALQMKAERWDPDFEPQDLKRLGDVVPPDLRASGTTKSEKAMAAIKFPDAMVSAKQATKMTQGIAEGTRKVRPSVIEDLKGKLPHVQVRILASAISLEERVAKMILNSPVPKELSDDQVAEYRTGIGELAKEFSNQADEYKKLVQAIDEKTQANSEEKKKLVAPLELDSIPRVRPEIEAIVQPLVDGRNATAALVVLDRWKNLNEIDETDYYTLRARLLVSSNPSQFMKEYVHGELLGSKQGALMDKWRKP